MLNSEQFYAARMGDWFCRRCPTNEGKNRYFWDSDIAALAATHTTNKWNVGLAAHNTSGVKGLHWNNKRACWVGRVCHDGHVTQRYSKDRAVVESWLVYTRNKLHGEFANHG